jgi:4-deoxy-L-threo-5-hexosulose-uronate ketol-isomerase
MTFDRKERHMELRTASSPRDEKHYDTQRLREEYLVEKLFFADDIYLVYSHIDRIIFGGAMPVTGPVKLEAGAELRADYFCERRELGLINIGGDGIVTADGVRYEVAARDGMYLGRGTKDITFESADGNNPAKFYLCSGPAHKTYPTKRILKDARAQYPYDVEIKPENKKELGSLEDANHRTINKYILPGQVESCQLEMGMTHLEPGSVWNTMPCHTHDRRMEVYLYFDLPEDAFVMHYMGEPQETRHLVVRNEQAVISPSWSIHAGSGSRNYTFIWGMVGENQDFDDMDEVPMQDLL